MNLKITTGVAVLCAGMLMSACSKKDDSAGVSSRNVKYEVTGNYTGKLLIVYSNESGVYQTISGVSVPWSKELTIDASTVNAGFTISTDGVHTGSPGQTVNAKLYVGGVSKKSADATADANGAIFMGGLVYSF